MPLQVRRTGERAFTQHAELEPDQAAVGRVADPYHAVHSLADEIDKPVTLADVQTDIGIPVEERGSGSLLWVGSSSTRGGTPPYLGPYFAAKAGMDALAVSYAGELARWGIETTIVVPGSFTTGTNHFAHAGKPGDEAVAAAYASGSTKDISDRALKGLAALSPADADPEDVARAIVTVVDTPFGRRPFRVHIDPARDGAEEVNGVADRMRTELLRNIGLGDLLKPAGA